MNRQRFQNPHPRQRRLHQNMAPTMPCYYRLPPGCLHPLPVSQIAEEASNRRLRFHQQMNVAEPAGRHHDWNRPFDSQQQRQLLQFLQMLVCERARNARKHFQNAVNFIPAIDRNNRYCPDSGKLCKLRIDPRIAGRIGATDQCSRFETLLRNSRSRIDRRSDGRRQCT
jgi:hypothetical protein